MESDCKNMLPIGYDAFRRACPSQAILETLASKWVNLVIVALRPGTLRHGQLARKLEGITPKMLTQTLRILERDGLVKRQMFQVIPPKVEYQLTELGQSLAGLMDQIRAWSEQHVREIADARQRGKRDNDTLAPSPP